MPAGPPTDGWSPDAATRLLGVVGHPVGHSLSPSFWNAALRHDRRNAVFLAFDVEPGSFDAFLAGVRAAGALGLSVTMPHKQAAYAACTRRSDEAEITRAVNTVWFEDSGVCGANTDVRGIARAVDDFGVRPESALVLGAGGAAGAAVLALSRLGADVVVANRTLQRATELCERVGHGRPLAWEDRARAAAQADLLVNATSIGLDGAGSPLGPDDLAAAASGRCRGVLDVVYRTGETELVLRARAAGVEAQDGLRMLVHQAAEAHRLMLGAEPPEGVMHRAAARAAGRVPTGQPVEPD